MDNGRVLIVDDDEIIRDVWDSILEDMGYIAEFAINGEDAVVRYQESSQAGAPIDLVIIDLTIPSGMGGVQALDALKRVDANVKAVVSSGNPMDEVMSECERFGFVGALKKPFDINRLPDLFEKWIKG